MINTKLYKIILTELYDPLHNYFTVVELSPLYSYISSYKTRNISSFAD